MMNHKVRKDDLSYPDELPKQYAYVLRVREARRAKTNGQENSSDWLFTLQNSRNNAVHNFRDIEALMTFLQSTLDTKLDKTNSTPETTPG